MKIILLRYYLLCVHYILILLLKILLINLQVSWEVDIIILVIQMRETVFRDSREQSKGYQVTGEIWNYIFSTKDIT